MHQHVSVDTLVTQIETYLKSKNLPYAVSDDNDPSTIKTNIDGGNNTNTNTKSSSKSSRFKSESFGPATHLGQMRRSYYTDDGETDQSIICVEHVMIEDQITSVTDLLQLCEKYKLAENVRYNIDMQSLHKICPYLRELNNMIGMQSIKTTVLDQIIYFIQKLHLPPNSDAVDGSNDATQQLPPICCSGPAMINSNPFFDSSATSNTLPTFKMADGILFHFKNPFSFGGGDVEQIYSNGNSGNNSNTNSTNSKPNSGKPASTSTTASSSSTSASSSSPNQNTPLGGGAGTIASIFANMNISGSGSGGNPFSCKTKSGGRTSTMKQSASSNRIPTGDFMHTVLYGPPGTGKTEVAKILGNIFCHLGILKANTFKKVTRSDLIAGYLGQTAIKTREVIDSAIGGVLFIDEAYALGNTEKRDSFSKECIDTLCEALSDHKHELMVIIAGYEKELTDCFFSYNEGLSSRFTWRYKIDNYSAVDLRKIFEKIVRDNRWSFKEVDAVKDVWFKEHYDYFKYFGRDIEVFFTKTKIAHSRRVFCRPADQRRSLNMKDLETGFELFSQNEDVKSRGNRFNGPAATLYL
jgi:hypothetical protein